MLSLTGLQGCTVLAVADAAGSAVIYADKTVINTVDALTPDFVNKKNEVQYEIAVKPYSITRMHLVKWRIFLGRESVIC